MRRVTALDGLRGAAALTVVAHHALLLFPALAAPYFTGRPAALGEGEWWLIHTPLHVLWEGKFGVYVFFVLSGCVLTLPALNGRGYVWRIYYPSRLLRLYLPVWGAVIFAALTFLVVPRTAEVASAWLDKRPEEVTVRILLKDTTLVTGTGGIASPLWSLTWEVLFSLVLPAAIWLAIKLRRAHGLLAVAALLASASGGIIDEPLLLYSPMFLLGVIIAMRREQIARVAGRLPAWAWVLLLIAGVLAASSRWLFMAFGAPGFVVDGTVGLMLTAACVFVVMAIEWPAATRVFDSRPLRLLGRLSFSLYLVHEPIVVAAGFALPDNPALAAAAAVLITAAVTPLFYLLVEKPSHRLARMVARATQRSSATDTVVDAPAERGPRKG